ncbi:MAG: radical SAM protein [candidate division SR1 bacterium]|nr:radical SAM protein [candidate division SR1 bacterium]
MYITMDLIQPRHSYAHEEGKGQIYTNTSLWTIGTILDNAGVDISLHDENFGEVESLSSDTVGISLLGAPYIPVVKDMMQRLKSKFGNDLKFVLGGQVLTQKQSKMGKTLGLDTVQFKNLFGEDVVNGMQEGTLEQVCNIQKLSTGYDVSLIPMYEKLSDTDFLTYFTKEISLYVSQGCKFDCDFCAAVKHQKEQYREAQVMYIDLSYIAERLQRLGEHKVSIYMSNLDVFQSPKQLEGFADMMLQIQKEHPGFTFNLRGLAGTKSFVYLDRQHPQILEKLVQAGFTAAGYGVDGMGPEIWKGIKKPQNNEKDVLDAIRVSKGKYNITPELLMVFGHVGVDTPESLKHSYDFVQAMVEKYGAVPRPHIAKPFVPGNDGRNHPKFQQEVATLIQQPQLFQSLDFTALASKLTHPDKAFRDLVNYYYLEMCKLPGNTTLPIIPYDIGDSQQVLEQKRKENLGKFDR